MDGSAQAAALWAAYPLLSGVYMCTLLCIWLAFFGSCSLCLFFFSSSLEDGEWLLLYTLAIAARWSVWIRSFAVCVCYGSGPGFNDPLPAAIENGLRIFDVFLTE